jgi:hypothetical protein
MPVTPETRWEDLDEETRRELDAQYLLELDDWGIYGVSDEGIRVYLAYRHERPGAAITTYEEGQIRKMLHEYADDAQRPDPVAEEEHLDPLERYGAKRFHFTNQQTYVAVMLLLTFGAVIVLAIWLIFGWASKP